MPKLIECVPNFSEGRDLNVIRQITAAIEAVEQYFAGGFPRELLFKRH